MIPGNPLAAISGLAAMVGSAMTQITVVNTGFAVSPVADDSKPPAFHLDGQTSGGTTVNFTTEADTPSPGFTRVTATATGTLPDRLFVDVEVTGP